MSTLLPLLLHQQQGGQEVTDTTPQPTATYSITVDWDGDGISTGVYDELVGMAGYGVKSLRVRRGRDDELAAMVAGEADIVLHDPDGRFNPQNAASPLNGLILPLREVTITASNDGGATTWPLFAGYIRSVEHDPRLGVQETRIHCTDLFVWLARATPVVNLASGGNDIDTGTAIAFLINDSGYSGPTIYIDNGDLLGDGSVYETDGSATCLAEIEALLQTERGVFYIDASGFARYEDRNARGARTSEATITDTMIAARSGIDLDSIGNRARVTKIGGVEQEANDAASQALYGVADIPAIESQWLQDDIQAASLATYLVGLFKDPRPPIYGLDLINRDVATMDLILQREIQDRITVTDSRGGTDGDFYIEGIEHEVTDGGKFHRCRWRLSSSTSAATFIVGVSDVGGTDVISY